MCAGEQYAPNANCEDQDSGLHPVESPGEASFHAAKHVMPAGDSTDPWGQHSGPFLP